MIFKRWTIDEQRATALPLHPWVIAAGLIAVQVALLIGYRFGEAVVVEGLMLGVPALGAIFLRPRPVLAVAVVTVVCVLTVQVWISSSWTEDATADVTGAALIGGAAVAASHLRERRDRRLAQVRFVADATQRVLLRPLPSRLGHLEISSMYLAADQEALIGGDLYGAALVGGVPRVIVGDAQGKGTAATELAHYLFGAFRRAAREGTPLEALPGFLDRCLHEELVDAAEWESRTSRDTRACQRLAEGFATAVVVDISRNRIDVANCGHTFPLLVSEGKVRELAPLATAPPLGLGELRAGAWRVDRFEFAPGDTLLLYTDGVTEARSEDGAFYPLAERLPDWTGHAPSDLLAAIRADLKGHAPGRLTDDAVVVVIRHVG